MLKVQFKFDKSVSYWSNSHGASHKINGESMDSHWDEDISHLNESIEFYGTSEILIALENILIINNLPYDYFAIMDDGRISFNTIEDGNGYILDNKKSIEFEENGGQPYICDYGINIEIHEVYQPNISKLQEIFPEAEY